MTEQTLEQFRAENECYRQTDLSRWHEINENYSDKSSLLVLTKYYPKYGSRTEERDHIDFEMVDGHSKLIKTNRITVPLPEDCNTVYVSDFGKCKSYLIKNPTFLEAAWYFGLKPFDIQQEWEDGIWPLPHHRNEAS